MKGRNRLVCACAYQLASFVLLGLLLTLPLEAQTLRPAGATGVLFEKRYFGLHMHRAEVVRWPVAPFGSWRMWDAGVTWATIEKTPGKYDFGRLDQYVAMAEQKGIEVVLPFGLTPTWASQRPQEWSHYGPGHAAEPADPETWRRFVGSVARRYAGRVYAYQIWNEANLKGFFTGDMAALVALTRIAREEIKLADPSALIVGPSGAGLLDTRRNFLVDFLRAGGGPLIDRMAFHFYTSQQKPETMIGPVQDLQAQTNDAGFGAMPLWNTETGYLTRSTEPRFGSDDPKAISEELAAAYLVRALVLARAMGVERFHWYAWDDSKYAMTKADYATPNAVGKAFSQIIQRLDRVRLFECFLDVTGPAVCQLQDVNGRPFRLAWSSNDSATLWTTSTPVWVHSLEGERLNSEPVSRVVLQAMPVVIETPTTADREPGT